MLSYSRRKVSTKKNNWQFVPPLRHITANSTTAESANVYLRLKEHGVETVGRCDVPRILRYDDELWVIEMTVVSRPFVLDFAGAYLDRSPEFSDEVLADWLVEKQEQFGSHWAEVQSILGSLQSYGVFMINVNPGNVSFGD